MKTKNVTYLHTFFQIMIKKKSQMSIRYSNAIELRKLVNMYNIANERLSEQQSHAFFIQDILEINSCNNGQCFKLYGDKKERKERSGPVCSEGIEQIIHKYYL